MKTIRKIVIIQIIFLCLCGLLSCSHSAPHKINKITYEDYESLAEELNCIVIQSDEPFDLLFYDDYYDNNMTKVMIKKAWDGELYYSIDKKNWNEWDGSKIHSSENNTVFLRGTNNSYISKDFSFLKQYNSLGSFVLYTSRFFFTGVGFANVYGNVETLLDYKKVKNGIHPQMAEGCFKGLFSGWRTLKKAPVLGADTLSSFCYNYMFHNCKSLEIPPELPSMNLAYSCYRAMFYGCDNLKTAPSLPAVTLSEYCYGNMFCNCFSLEVFPQLPAQKLETGCYSEMFSGCDKLTQMIELPAQELAEYCYFRMFSDCKNLKKVSALPATQLAGYCYGSMFYGCTSLVSAPALPATQLAVYCYWEMFYGCTSLVSAPALPATQLAEYCYCYMFSGCTSLVSAPALPATQLAKRCYLQMFERCSSLKKSPVLPAVTIPYDAYVGMFSSSGLETLPDLSHITSINYDSSLENMFSDTKIRLRETNANKGSWKTPNISWIYFQNLFSGCPDVQIENVYGNTVYYYY